MVATISVQLPTASAKTTSGARDGEAVEGIDEIGEAAAEAAAGDLVGGDAVGLHEVGVDEVVALVVENDGDGGSAALEEFGGGEDEGGLAGA